MRITPQQLYRLRRFHGLNTVEMAALLVCTDSYVSRIENGIFPMTERIQDKATEVFGLNPNRMRAVTLHYENHIAPFENKEA